MSASRHPSAPGAGPSSTPNVLTAYTYNPRQPYPTGELEHQDESGTVLSTRVSRPIPGSTFFLQSVQTGKVVSFWNGKVELAEWQDPNDPKMTRWQCVETEGWLGFRDSVSFRYLGSGHGISHEKLFMSCQSAVHSRTEKFQVREVGGARVPPLNALPFEYERGFAVLDRHSSTTRKVVGRRG